MTRNEKRLLHNIAARVGYWPEGMGRETLAGCASALERLGLIQVAWECVHDVVDARLIAFGTAYLLANPSLRNPIDWKWITATILGAATLAVAILGLFVACSAVYTK